MIFANPLIKYDASFSKTISWILTNFRMNNLSLTPFIISDFNGSKTFAPLCTCLTSLENFTTSMDFNVTVYTSDSNTAFTGGCKVFMCLPICYLYIKRTSNLLSRHRLAGDIYIAPAGIRARIWASTNERLLTGCNFKGFLDSSKQMEDVFCFESIKGKSSITVLVATKYFFREIFNKVSSFTGEDNIIDVSSICYSNRNGLYYALNLNEKMCAKKERRKKEVSLCNIISYECVCYDTLSVIVFTRSAA